MLLSLKAALNVPGEVSTLNWLVNLDRVLPSVPVAIAPKSSSAWGTRTVKIQTISIKVG